MPFITPLALIGLVFVPLVIAMYMLKLRRDQAVVPSTLLWSRLLTDVEANAPWQRLRRSLLLLLQLLLVLVLVLLAARPFVERPAGLARDIVLVMDVSASMGATDVAPDRLEAARQAALAALQDLPTGGRVSVIAADRSARIVVNETTDLGRVRQALADLRPAPMRGNLGDALELAGKLAARSGDAEILVATDAAIGAAPAIKVDARITVLPVGRDRKNQAIVALAVRSAPSAVTRSAFIGIANLDIESAQRRIEIWGDDSLLEARDITLGPQARSDVVIDDVPPDVDVLEVRLVSQDPATASAPDQLALDDRAWAVMPSTGTKLILVVGEGDPYLETALSYLPNVELFGVLPKDYGPGTERTDGRPWDLVIFEGTLPATLPKTAILAIAPPRSSALGDVTGTLRDPGIGSLSPDEPILRFVDLTTTHISQAQRLVTPDWARTVIPGPRGAPLLYAGLRAGLPTAVLAFEPRRSDLPLQVAFPILLANLTGELLGGSTAPADTVAPGTPVTLIIPGDATGVTVTGPDGATTDLTASLATWASVTFAGTKTPGIYTVTPIRAATPSGTPTSSPSGASPSPSGASPSPSASAGAGTGASPTPFDPDAPVRFAVALFDVDESTIAPGSAARIEALGLPADPTPTGGAAAERPTTRNELWVPIVLLVLVGLCLEWAVFHRDAVVRIRRSLEGRFGNAATDGTP